MAVVMFRATLANLIFAILTSIERQARKWLFDLLLLLLLLFLLLLLKLRLLNVLLRPLLGCLCCYWFYRCSNNNLDFAIDAIFGHCWHHWCCFCCSVWLLLLLLPVLVLLELMLSRHFVVVSVVVYVVVCWQGHTLRDRTCSAWVISSTKSLDMSWWRWIGAHVWPSSKARGCHNYFLGSVPSCSPDLNSRYWDSNPRTCRNVQIVWPHFISINLLMFVHCLQSS